MNPYSFSWRIYNQHLISVKETLRKSTDPIFTQSKRVGEGERDIFHLNFPRYNQISLSSSYKEDLCLKIIEVN